MSEILSFDEHQHFLKFSDRWKCMGWKGPLEVILSSLLLPAHLVPVDQELCHQKQLLNSVHRDGLTHATH